ncbi:MAG: YeeE/YedE family protein [Phycisphaerae bacterium]|nr:YeeE/YedE family protein [Phycisphaerae bacterium]
MVQTRSTLWNRQWSFALGGLVVGLGEVIHYLVFKKFIMVTTGLAWMFSTVEANITHTQTISRMYPPNVHWVIIGALLAAWLVGRSEGQSRNWMKYSPGMLALALLGGIIFGFGTRIGPGCTTHHIFGGLGVMSIASITIAVVGLPFAFLTFEIMGRLGFGAYFKHQENRPSVERCRRLETEAPQMHAKLDLGNDHRLAHNPEYRPWRDPIRMMAWSIVAVLVLSSLWTGFFGNESQSLASGSLWPKLVLLVAGGALGWGIAKAGVGTECGLMAPESLWVSDEHYRRLNVPYVTRRMFKALLPVSGILAAIIPLNAVVVVMWVFFNWPVPDAAPKPAGWGLHIGHLLAAPCLAIGSVLMIGCEIRSYGRVGLGYLTGIVGLIGFYFGYLPYVYYAGPIDSFIARYTFLRPTNVPELLTNGPAAQKIVGLVYLAMLLTLFAIVVRYGARRLETNPRAYLTRSTDELAIAPALRGQTARGSEPADLAEQYQAA